AFLLTQVVVQSSGMVMLDIVVAACAMEAAVWLSRYADSHDWRHAAAFGLAAACCCLTKGNGVAIVLVPMLFMLFSRRVDLLRKPGLYIAAAIVFSLAAPLLLIAYRMDDAMGDFAV